jgi:RHS repeat-associated protein
LSVSQQANSGYATTSYTYNSFGEPLTVTDPLGNVTTNTYDTHGNLLTVTTPAPNGNTAASVTQFTYNSLGELTQITDPLNRITKLAYTSAGLIYTVTDPQSNVTTYRYDSFGNLTASSGSIANRFQYTARELDPETGIYFYRARYYDATTGHFLSEDPVGFEGGVNFYPYAENDPVIFSDPFGLQSGTPSGCSPPFRTPCGPSLYGPPVDPTAPPPPTAPTVPSWWPGTGPGSGSGSSASPGSGPSPSPEPSPAPGGGSQQCDQNKGKWHCRAKCYVLRSKGEDIVGVTYGDGYGNSQADAASAALKNAANSTAKGFRTKHCHTVSCEKR